MSTNPTDLHQDLVATYATERLKTLAVWAVFTDGDLPWRPPASDGRGRSVHEQFVHQCVSEDRWFQGMLGIATGLPPLPTTETRLEFLRHYAAASAVREAALAGKPAAWWVERTGFFTEPRSRAWVVMRRLVHSSHHRGQLTAYLRVLGRDLWSTYGPTADTGGLMQHQAPTIYAYDDIDALLEGEAGGGAKRPLPPPTDKPVSERPS